MRPEGEIENYREQIKKRVDEEDSRYFEGMLAALEWVLEDSPTEEKFGKRIESCPVKGADCDAGPFYGIALLAHMKKEHPEAYDGVTK